MKYGYVATIVLVFLCSGCFDGSTKLKDEALKVKKEMKMKRVAEELKEERRKELANIEDDNADRELGNSERNKRKLAAQAGIKIALNTFFEEQKKVLVVQKKYEQTLVILSSDEFCDFALMKKNKTMAKWISIVKENNVDLRKMIIGWANLDKKVEAKLISIKMKKADRLNFMAGLRNKLMPKLRSLDKVYRQKEKVNNAYIALIEFYKQNQKQLTVDKDGALVMDDAKLNKRYDKTLSDMVSSEGAHDKLYDEYIDLLIKMEK